MNTAYISLGSNIGPSLEILKEAKEELGLSGQVSACSSFYRTKPVDYLEQDDFINAVIRLETELTAHELLDKLQELELKHKRTRHIRYGPRTLDLDIILFNDSIIHDARLSVPHPRMHERAFVLIPLAEIAGDIRLPLYNTSLFDLKSKLSDEDILGVVKLS